MQDALLNEIVQLRKDIQSSYSLMNAAQLRRCIELLKVTCDPADVAEDIQIIQGILRLRVA